MAKVGTVKQQPNEVQDYDITFEDRIPADDVITGVTLSCVPAMPTPPSYAISSPIVKVWVYEGGVNGTNYKITALAETNDGRKVEAELIVKCKEE
jgi:hypothetical protein